MPRKTIPDNVVWVGCRFRKDWGGGQPHKLFKYIMEMFNCICE